MKTINGDLLKLAKEGFFETIGHGCNCHNQMGACIARQIREQFPEVWRVDQLTVPGDKSKLGTITYFEYETFTVVNCYTQYNYTRSKVDADYDAIRSCMKALKNKFSGKRIGLPLIGAGLAGGDWNIIAKIIEEELCDEDVTIVKWSKN